MAVLLTAEEWVAAVGDERADDGTVTPRRLSFDEMLLRQIVILTRQMEDLQGVLSQPMIFSRVPPMTPERGQPTGVEPDDAWADEDEDVG